MNDTSFAIYKMLPTVFTQFGNGTVTNCKLASLKNMVGNDIDKES